MTDLRKAVGDFVLGDRVEFVARPGDLGTVIAVNEDEGSLIVRWDDPDSSVTSFRPLHLTRDTRYRRAWENP